MHAETDGHAILILMRVCNILAICTEIRPLIPLIKHNKWCLLIRYSIQQSLLDDDYFFH